MQVHLKCHGFLGEKVYSDTVSRQDVEFLMDFMVQGL